MRPKIYILTSKQEFVASLIMSYFLSTKLNSVITNIKRRERKIFTGITKRNKVESNKLKYKISDIDKEYETKHKEIQANISDTEQELFNINYGRHSEESLRKKTSHPDFKNGGSSEAYKWYQFNNTRSCYDVKKNREKPKYSNSDQGWTVTRKPNQRTFQDQTPSWSVIHKKDQCLIFNLPMQNKYKIPANTFMADDCKQCEICIDDNDIIFQADDKQLTENIDIIAALNNHNHISTDISNTTIEKNHTISSSRTSKRSRRTSTGNWGQPRGSTIGCIESNILNDIDQNCHKKIENKNMAASKSTKHVRPSQKDHIDTQLMSINKQDAAKKINGNKKRWTNYTNNVYDKPLLLTMRQNDKFLSSIATKISLDQVPE